MIYYAQLANGNIKIGWAGRPVRRRLKELAWQTGGPVRLLAVQDGDRAVEKAVHERFQHLRVGKSEQFKPHRLLASHIRYFRLDTGWIEKGPPLRKARRETSMASAAREIIEEYLAKTPGAKSSK